MATTQNTAGIKNNWPCFNSVAVWKNSKEDSTAMKVVKFIGTILVFPLLIAGFFDIVKKGYDFVWGEDKKTEEPAKAKLGSIWENIKNKITNACSWTANKVSNTWENHKKLITIGTIGAAAVGATAWYFSPFLAATTCSLTGFYCATPTKPTDTAKV